jgi:hypothetical protein
MRYKFDIKKKKKLFIAFFNTKVGENGFLGRKSKGFQRFQISRLKNLRKVSFVGLTRMNDRILRSITNKSLQSLDLSYCENVGIFAFFFKVIGRSNDFGIILFSDFYGWC